MARPIEPTPVLRGIAAKKFVEMAATPKPVVERKIDYRKMHE
jgi:hypothetical protein